MASYKESMELDISDVNKMTEKELRRHVRMLSDVANKRVRRILESGTSSSAVSGLYQKGEWMPFGTGGKNRNQLMKEFLRAKTYLSKETSSLTGVKNVRKRLQKRLGNKMSQEQENAMWKAYNRLEEISPIILKQYDSNQVQSMLSEWSTEILGEPTSEDVQNMIDRGLEVLRDFYEGEVEEEDEISSFFSAGKNS